MRLRSACGCGLAAIWGSILFAQAVPAKKDLLLRDYAPKTRLLVDETEVRRSKFPSIDIHLHMNPAGDPLEIVKLMDTLNVQTVVNLGQGDNFGPKLKAYVDKWVTPYPSRFGVMANLNAATLNDADFGTKAVAQLREDVRNGAIALKVFKSLGLSWKDKTGKLIRPDDPRFDPVWDACAELNIPVLIHVNDVSSFFDPVDEHNERYLSLIRNPASSLYGKVDISHEELMQRFEHLIASHPKTTFIAAHVGMNYEHLYTGARWLDAYPNLYYDIAASYKHLGRQPNTARKFLIKYQNRVLFGCDIGNQPTTKIYRYMFRVLETDDDYFDFPEPEAGIWWKLYGLSLPDAVLEKIYNGNARKVIPAFRLATPNPAH